MPGILLNYNFQSLVSVASTHEEMKLPEEVLVASPEISFLNKETDGGVYSAVGWTGTDGRERELRPGGGEPWRACYVPWESVNFTERQLCFLIHQPWCFLIPLWANGGDFSKQSSLGSFLMVRSSSSYFISNDLKLNVYGWIFTFLERGNWNAAQSKVCGLGGGGRARPSSLAGILFPPEITNSTWERQSEEQLQHLLGKSLKS